MAKMSASPLNRLLGKYSGLSREAKLMLARVALFGLGMGIWTVIFNLYLISLGFDAAFVARMVSMKWWAHGAFVLPAGIIADLYGRRKTFLIAIFVAVMLNVLKLASTDPGNLLFLNGAGGIAESFLVVAGGPFLMEHSKEEERIYLFSFYTFFMMMASTVGSVLGGVLPGVGGWALGLKADDTGSFRFALSVAIPLMLLSLIPIYMIKEKWQRRKLSAWWKGIKSWPILGMMALSTCLTGLAIGFTFPFYNIFFAQRFGASPSAIGMIFAAGSLAGALGTVLAPALESRLGKVNTITAARLASVPFLMGMVLVPGLAPVVIFYLSRRTSMSAGFPVRALFRMEIVEDQERGTTSGLVHAMAEFPIGVSAWMAGGMMARGDWLTPYSWASLFLVASAAVFFFYFRPLEKRLNKGRV